MFLSLPSCLWLKPSTTPICENVELFGTINDPIHGDLDVPGFPLKFSEFPEELPLHAPTLGQHNEEVLTLYLGRSIEEVEQLREAGVLVEENR